MTCVAFGSCDEAGVLLGAAPERSEDCVGRETQLLRCPSACGSQRVGRRCAQRVCALPSKIADCKTEAGSPVTSCAMGKLPQLVVFTRVPEEPGNAHSCPKPSRAGNGA